MNILSLFDGISCARVALDRAGIKVDKYYASENDKYALQVAEKNYLDNIQLGDVRGVKKEMVGEIDLLIGGFPCQDLSIAKNNRKGLVGERSGLFWEMVRIHNEVKPKYFIYENVFSMAKDQKDIITKTLGVEAVMIDAKLVSPQQRKRFYWVGKLVKGRYETVAIPQPKDKHIYLDSIIESGEAVKEKAYCLTANQKDFINNFIKRHQGNYVFKDKPIRISSIGKGGQGYRIYSVHGKSVCLSAKGGGLGAKTGLYLITGGAKRSRENKGKQLEVRKDGKSNCITKVSTDSLVVFKDYFRPLTPVECERLQGLTDNFTQGLSKTRRKEVIGNAFNVDVILHILNRLNNRKLI